MGLNGFLQSVGRRSLSVLRRGPSRTVVVWNSADKTAGVTLSNGDLTAFATDISSIVNATLARSAGKYVFAINPDLLAGTTTWRIGIRNNAATVALDDAIWVAASGGVTRAVNASTITAATVQSWLASASEVMIAVDLNAGKFWVKVDAGNWNNSATANPATGVEGIDFSAIIGQSFFPMWFMNNTNDNQVTANFGASPFTNAIPAGFTSWDGSQTA